MSATATTPEYFVDRRGNVPVGSEPLFERRQFANSYDELSPDAAELARAIDGYKVQHRRRFVTFEEMLARDQIARLFEVAGRRATRLRTLNSPHHSSARCRATRWRRRTRRSPESASPRSRSRT